MTGEHPFWVGGRGWVEVQAIQPEDRLWSLERGWLWVRSVHERPAQEPVYNLRVAEDRTYFVGDSAVWVHNKGAAGGIPKPSVTDPKLGNLVKDLYKGANTKSPIGTGSTADAIRHEAATGQAVGGKFHAQKGQEYARALEKWLAKNPGASSADRSAAQSILNDLRNALGGT